MIQTPNTRCWDPLPTQPAPTPAPQLHSEPSRLSLASANGILALTSTQHQRSPLEMFSHSKVLLFMPTNIPSENFDPATVNLHEVIQLNVLKRAQLNQVCFIIKKAQEGRIRT